MRRHIVLTFVLSVATLVSVTANASALPIANAGGPYWVQYWLDSGEYKGTDLLLDGTGSYDGDAASGRYITAYWWDLNGLGGINASGATPTVPFSEFQFYLNFAGISVQPGLNRSIQLQVVNDHVEKGVAYAYVTFDYVDPSVPVPEPASLILFGTGLVGLRVWRKRRQ